MLYDDDSRGSPMVAAASRMSERQSSNEAQACGSSTATRTLRVLLSSRRAPVIGAWEVGAFVAFGGAFEL